MNATPKSMRKVILSGIRKSILELGSATKAELSDKLGISFPTVSKFLAQMEKDKEIILVGLDDSVVEEGQKDIYTIRSIC